MAEPGVCPLAVWRPAPNFGYPSGNRNGNQPRFFVDHIIAGFKRRMDEPDYFLGGAPSVHFAIGKDGSISQYVRIQDAAWGNGITGSFRGDRTGIDKFERANRHLAELERMCGGNWFANTNSQGVIDSYFLALNGRNMPNSHSISIEHEDEAKGGHIEWTPEMYASDLALKRWCIEEVARLGLPPMQVDLDLLVGHCHINPVNRANCPGSAWPRERLLRDLLAGSTRPSGEGALKLTEYHIQDVWPTFFGQDDGLKIAGGQSQRINTFVDFGWPQNVKLGEVEFMLQRGHVVVKHGDGREAGRVGWRVTRGRPSMAVIKVRPDAQGWIEISAADRDNPVQFASAHAVGFWT